MWSIFIFLWLWYEVIGGIVFCFFLDRMLVYCLVYFCFENFIGFFDSLLVLKLYFWVESGSVRVNCGVFECKVFILEEGLNLVLLI